MRQLPVLLSVSALLMGAFAANAGIVYNSLPQTSSGSDSIASLGPLYDSFSTGGDSGLISSVMFLLQGTSTDGGIITASLYADKSNTVGGFISALGTISDASLTGALSVVNLPLSSNPSLSSGTRYWIGLSTAGSASWSYTMDTSGVGVNGEFFQNQHGTFPNNPGGGYQMEVILGASVPEPSPFVPGTLALAALGVFARRRRRA